jgi:predicted nucleic acid-binding protein
VDAQILLERATAAGERLVTDAEVIQEILHRFSFLGRRDAIAPTVGLMLDLVDEVFAIEQAVVLRASDMVQAHAWLSTRDAVHLAVMERQQIHRIMSFDANFDRWPSVQRIFRA